MRHLRRWAVGGFVLATALLTVGAGARACVFGPSVFLNPSQVKAGETVQVEGLYFKAGTKVVARFQTLDGPILAEFDVPTGDRQMISGPLTIPAATAPGNYVIVFTQPGANGAPIQVPARALVTVLGAGGVAPAIGKQVGSAGDARANQVATEDSSIGAGTLLLVGIGAAIAFMVVAGGVTLAATRRASSRPAEKVTA